MRLHEIVHGHLDGVREVVDVTHEQVDLERHLRLPAEVRHRRVNLAQADRPDLGPGVLVLALIGPNPPGHTDPDALSPLLGRLRPGARILLLGGWPVEEFPYHRLLGPLVGGSAQVLTAAPLDRVAIRGVHFALVAEAVTELVPPRPYLTGADRSPAAPEQSELRTAVRIANEYVLADLVMRPVRARMIELAERVDVLDRLVAERDGQLREARRALAETQARLAAPDRPAPEDPG